MDLFKLALIKCRITLLEMYPMSIPEIEGIKKSTFISSIDIHNLSSKIKSDYIWLGALFANLRVEFYNQSGSIVQFYQYKKRSGVFAPLVIKRGPNKVWGFFFSGTENPSPKILASVQTFKKEFPESVNFILHNEKKVDLVNSSTVILPIYGIFNSNA